MKCENIIQYNRRAAAASGESERGRGKKRAKIRVDDVEDGEGEVPRSIGTFSIFLSFRFYYSSHALRKNNSNIMYGNSNDCLCPEDTSLVKRQRRVYRAESD